MFPRPPVEYVIMGQVLTAGTGQMPARQAAVAAGIGWDVPSLTINKMCLSGIDAIALADQLIRAGEFDVVVAGGQESMTQAPHLLMNSRSGYKYGDVTVLDHMAYDGLHDVFTDQPMGALDRAAQRRGPVHPHRAGRIRRRLAPEGRRGLEGRGVRRRGRCRQDPAAQGRSDGVRRGRGHPGQHHRRVAGRPQAGVPQRRHHHRRFGVPDLRRRRRGRGDEQGQGRASSG